MLNWAWQGYERLQAALDRLLRPDPTHLLGDIGRIIAEGNRAGILEGTDKNDMPMVPTKYRTSLGAPTPRRRGRKRGTTAFAYQAGGGANLTSAQYRELTGPPLAPRGERSRVITNLQFEIHQQGEEWILDTYWADVVSRKGVPFLQAHFAGTGRLPKRDLAGIRPRDWALIEPKLRDWIRVNMPSAR